MFDNERFLWVDPPSGWQFGFPKIWDKQKYPNLLDFLKKHNVPENIINLDRYRFWVADEEQIKRMQEDEKN